MQNPQQIISQLSAFMNNFKGDPKAEAMKAIQSAGLNQQQLNQLQSQASQIYQMGQQMGLFK